MVTYRQCVGGFENGQTYRHAQVDDAAVQEQGWQIWWWCSWTMIVVAGGCSCWCTRDGLDLAEVWQVDIVAGSPDARARCEHADVRIAMITKPCVCGHVTRPPYSTHRAPQDASVVCALRLVAQLAGLACARVVLHAGCTVARCTGSSWCAAQCAACCRSLLSVPKRTTLFDANAATRSMFHQQSWGSCGSAISKTP